jgi:hypothetical protein
MKQNKYKASILVASLLVLLIILSIAMAVSITAIKQRQSSSGAGKSSLAFQNANTGVEKVLSAINGSSNINDIAVSGATCNVGTGKIADNTGKWEVTLVKNDGTIVSCSDGSSVSTLDSIRSVGNATGEQRAIQAAVAAGTLVWNDVASTVGFQNGWSNSSSDMYNAAYAQDTRTGIVYLRGLVQNTSTTTGWNCIFTLPSSFAPSKRLQFTVSASTPNAYDHGSNVPYAYIMVKSSGCVSAATLSSGQGWLTLDGVNFPLN